MIEQNRRAQQAPAEASHPERKHKRRQSFNRPFLSSPVPLFQNESKCETFHIETCFARSFIFMQIKAIFIRMVLNLDSF